jgi:hypothetical protein
MILMQPETEVALAELRLHETQREVCRLRLAGTPTPLGRLAEAFDGTVVWLSSASARRQAARKRHAPADFEV